MCESGSISVRHRTFFGRYIVNIKIHDFGLKLELVLRSGKTTFKKHSDILKKMSGVSPDYFSRLKKGQRSLSENVFIKIVELTGDTGLKDRDWYQDITMFGKKLGFTSVEIRKITGEKITGVDFLSRNRDKNNLTNIHKVIAGYWESFYYSVSTFDVQKISVDLLIIGDLNDDGFMHCKVIDGTSTYVGHCFPTQSNHLYFILEKQEIHDEIIVYMMNRPERAVEPILNGVILCASGGVQDMVPMPCAARVAFRYLGNSETTEESLRIDIPTFLKEQNETIEDALARLIPGYLVANTITEKHPRYFAVKKIIDNEIKHDQIPYALRMDRKSEPTAGIRNRKDLR